MFSADQKCRISWSSPKQVITILKSLGVNTQTKNKKTGSMKDSADAKVLAPQKKDFDIIPLFSEFQQQGKLVSTYGENVLRQIHWKTGRIHTVFRQLQATGRMSCGETNKKLGIEHVNLQNVPADHRHRGCFVPEEGNMFIISDYSGQEDIIFANKCQDEALLDFYFQKLGDGHSYVAKLCFPELHNTPLEDIKKQYPELRQKAKSANFAIKFGGVGLTISTNLSIPMEEGEAIYNSYMNAFPGIANYFKKCKTDALNNGYVVINPISGRKCFIDGFDEYKDLQKVINQQGFWQEYRTHKDEETDRFFAYYKPMVSKYFKIRGAIERISLNYPVQGSGADITKFAGVKFFNYLIENNLLNIVKICNIVHDEIVVEAPREMAENLSKVLQQCMEDAGKPFCTIIPLVAKPVVLDFWDH